MNHKNQELRIAMISEHGDPLSPLGGQQAGGQNVYVYELARELSKLGVKVDVFTRWENRKAAQIVRFAQRVKVIRLKAGPRHFISKDKFGPLMPEFVEHFLEYQRSNKINYDLIHTHYYFSGWAGLQFKRILKKPLVHISHSLGLIKKHSLGENDTSPSERTAIERQIMQEADVIIATSPQEKLDAMKEYKVSGVNIRVIPAGVNLKRFFPLDKDKARRRLKLALDQTIIVFAGKMEKRKGGETLVKAIAELRRRWPKIFQKIQVFMFTGDPRRDRKKEKKESDTRYTFKSLIRHLHLEEKVKVSPGIGQDKLHFYYGAANIVVMPSYYEPFGMVAIEAMATGTPVVASNTGGLKWIVEDGITGYHAEPKNYRDFTQQFVKILKDPGLEERLSKNSVIRASQNYSWSIIAEKILALYQELVNKN